MTCPRCGRLQPPEEALRRLDPRLCVHCGRTLSGVRWVASEPPGSAAAPVAAPTPYSGPPSYGRTPGWSLGRWVENARPDDDRRPDRRPDPAAWLRSVAGLLRTLALPTALLAVVAGLAEGWRYVLLMISRSSALSPLPLAFSDTLVDVAGVLTVVGALGTALLFLRWLLDARALVADRTGTEPSRPTRALLLGTVLPPSTLTVPGSALAELEHAASDRPAEERPRPSRPVATWWVAWAVSVVLGVVAVLRGLGASTQAMADAVLLHGLADLAAAVAAVLTVRVVEHLTELIAPALRASGRESVVRVAA